MQSDTAGQDPLEILMKREDDADMSVLQVVTLPPLARRHKKCDDGHVDLVVTNSLSRPVREKGLKQKTQKHKLRFDGLCF